MSPYFRPSAGAIVVRSRQPGQMLVLDQVRKNGERQVVAPKGGIENGENTLKAAHNPKADLNAIRAFSEAT